MLNFDNRFVRELPGDPDGRNFPRQVHRALWTEVTPTPVRSPTLLAHSADMAQRLGIADPHSPALLAALAGNALLPGMASYATCYGGHQFGQWAGQLGDGRAIYLGESIAPDGERWELQLKGAGMTPYSRHADGRAVLRSSVREFLCSEAMHHLGIATTRALSLVGTGEAVMRDMFYDGNARAEPGAIVCRVAPSFIRFGHFELPAARDDRALLQQLADFTMRRDFPHITATDPVERIGLWFGEVCERTGRTIAQWMAVGFVHGVMNTDNMSILGLTIDYGPYGWIEDFDPGWTPNTTDAEGRRYCFGRQPEIARWNLERLAIALRPLLPDDDLLGRGLQRYDQAYSATTIELFAQKLGFDQWRDTLSPLLDRLFELLFHSECDMTDFFRRLGQVDLTQSPDAVLEPLRESSYAPARWQAQATDWAAWIGGYAREVGAGETAPGSPESAWARRQRMEAVNPRYVLRNYLAQQAIELAEAGDTSGITELLTVLQRPYDEQPEFSRYAAMRPEWARHKAGCSSLSCSS